MAETKIKYAGSTTITCTLASLASSQTAGRMATAVDNGTNLYDDILVTIGVKTSASALANDKAVYVYVSGSEDGTNYDSDDTVITTPVDGAYTINLPSNLKLAACLNCPTSSKTYYATFSLARLFGGACPRKWTLVVVNFTGQALDATEGNHQKTYTGVTYTNT
ncbi:MAG TPA: hypothetical protein VEU08_19970 [Vicinamibacterales bacterium]|nr:hypothetical protein [Vicinamibacterales bacterium]